MTLLAAAVFVNTLFIGHATARDGIAEECAKANVAAVADLLGAGSPAFIEASTEQQIAAQYGTHDFGGWALAMYPSAKGRMAGVLGQMALIDRMRKAVDPADTRTLPELFDQTAQHPPAISPETLAFLKSRFNDWRKGTYYDSQIAQFKAGAPYFCSYFSLFGCVGPVKTILDWMHPHDYSGWSVSMVDLWERIFTDAEYTAGISKAAAIVYQRITEVRVKRNRRAAISDIFADLVAGYRAVGKPEAEAKRRAIDVLGAYSTRGASMVVAYSLGQKETLAPVAALTFLSSAMSYLDMIQPEGRYYSLSPATSGTCMYGKPYHFWMGAYFVYALTARDLSRKEAAVAAHIVGRVYESNSATYGRDPNQAFYEKLLSPHNNQLRANLAINDAGVFWAAEDGKRPFNVNAAIELLKSKAIELPSMSPQELKELLKKPVERDKAWIKMFAPDILIDQWLVRTRVTR